MNPRDRMQKLSFTKMAGTGNDFIVIDEGSRDYSRLARALCQRKTAVGADGLLVLGKSKKADFKMRIFNADGSEAEMCGNGLRCAALHKALKGAKKTHKLRIETMAGIYEAELKGKDAVRIRMEEPKDIKRAIPITVNGREIKVNFIDIGVPHVVVFVQGLEEIDADNIGRAIRNKDCFKPRGTNVDFVEIIDDKNIKMRTYERGVEGETLACGTGAVASAIIAGHEASVHTKGGVLKVYFKKKGVNIKDVYLEGEAREVYKGEVDYV